MSLRLQIAEHVKKPCMHRAHAHIQPLLIHRFVAEIKIICVPILCHVVSLNPIPNPIELPTSSLVLALPLHLARLLID